MMSITAMTTLKRVLDAVRAEAPELPTQQLHALLVIGLDEGLSVQDVQKRTGMTNSSGSRNVRALMEYAGEGRKGLHWVDWKPNPQNLREKLLFLSPKGREVMDKMMKVMEG